MTGIGRAAQICSLGGVETISKGFDSTTTQLRKCAFLILAKLAPSALVRLHAPRGLPPLLTAQQEELISLQTIPKVVNALQDKQSTVAAAAVVCLQKITASYAGAAEFMKLQVRAGAGPGGR